MAEAAGSNPAGRTGSSKPVVMTWQGLDAPRMFRTLMGSRSGDDQVRGRRRGAPDTQC